MTHQHLLRRAAGILAVTAATVPALSAVASAAEEPSEGYKSPDGRVACVLLQGYDDGGNAVACGARGARRGVLLTGAGAARATAWQWPAADLGRDFFTATWGKTLFLSGGTAKLTGSASTLHCTFTRPTAVTCLKRTGHGLVVTPSRAATVTPVT